MRRRRKNNGNLLLLVLAVIIIIGGIVAGIWVSKQSDKEKTTVQTSSTASQTKEKNDVEITPTDKITPTTDAEPLNQTDKSAEVNQTEEVTPTEKVEPTKEVATPTPTSSPTPTKSTSDKDDSMMNTSTKGKTAATAGKKGIVYLTFDDGPSTSITPKILDILKEENVKATFFILNYNSEGEKLVKREHAEGHAIGIHGWSHTYSEIYQNENTYLNNLNKLQEKIKNSIGETVRITRFPGGSSNTISKRYNKGLMSKLVKLVQEKGYEYYDWNVDSDDAGSARNQTQVYNNVTKGLSKKRPNVVLMHDFAGNKKTLNALRDIIKFGKQNGYQFEPIKYNSGLISHHNVNN